MEGAEFLWDRVGDDAWRQVCLFFTAVDHNYVDGFLTGLAERSAEVAGHCLSAAVRVTTPVALGVLEMLRDDALILHVGNRSLAALMAATRAPKDDVRTAAVGALHVVLRSLADAGSQAVRGAMAWVLERVIRGSHLIVSGASDLMGPGGVERADGSALAERRLGADALSADLRGSGRHAWDSPGTSQVVDLAANLHAARQGLAHLREIMFGGRGVGWPCQPDHLASAGAGPPAHRE
jgi:hypothetical protein